MALPAPEQVSRKTISEHKREIYGQQPPPIILQSGNKPQHSIIWLHGLGADGQDFVPIVDELNLPVAVRYIFPACPDAPSHHQWGICNARLV